MMGQRIGIVLMMITTFGTISSVNVNQNKTNRNVAIPTKKVPNGRTTTADINVRFEFEDNPKYTYYNKNPCKASDCGSPLMVTPYIESGNATEAIELVKVKNHPKLSSVVSYSGFFTINATTGSNMFFWFFPAMDQHASTPVVISLQGGPGQSALFDIFNGFGPFRLNKHLEVKQNPYTLVKTLNVLYIDNPYGTGFSFTKEKDNYPKSLNTAADHLSSAISQFFQMFSMYRRRRVVIIGEGYGAKFAVAVARKIHDRKSEMHIKLNGVILGNPILGPEVIFNVGDYLYEMGILDNFKVNLVNEELQRAKYNAERHSYLIAMSHVHNVFGSPYQIPKNKQYYIPELIKDDTNENFEYDVAERDEFYNYIHFINQTSVRKAIHVGNLPFQSGQLAYNSLIEDILQPAKHDLSLVLDSYRILIYAGMKDKRVPHILALDVLEEIHWKHQNSYTNATREFWKLNPNNLDFDGYVRSAKDFELFEIRNSSRFVAFDQPEAAYIIVNMFMHHEKFGRLNLVER